MRQKQDLLCNLLQELDTWKQKIDELEELANNKSRDIPVDDLARRARKIAKNCIKKIEAIEEMASKERKGG